MMRLSLVLLVCLVGCARQPQISPEEQAKARALADVEQSIKATAESTAMDDVTAVQELFALSQQHLDAEKESYAAGQLKRSLPLMTVSQGQGGVNVMFPLLVGSTTFSKSAAEWQAHEQKTLAQILRPISSSLRQRHVSTLRTEMRMEARSRDGFKIKETLEVGVFDLAKASGGDPLTGYTKLQDSWSQVQLQRL